MKSFAGIFTFLTLAAMLPAQTPAPAKPAEKLLSAVFDWEKIPVTPTPKGARRDLFDGPTATLDKLHCHITTLNPGENSGEPSMHFQEEVILVKEGLVEASIDGKTQTVGPGSVFFMSSYAVTRLRNAGDTPCTYIVVNYYTPRTPRP